MESLNRYSKYVISVYEEKKASSLERGMTVNPIISEIATWYEKFRNVMDYREEEVILRAAIERILKRRLLFGGEGKTITEPLLRELVWARYIPDGSVTDETIDKVSKIIDVYLELRNGIVREQKTSEKQINEWIFDLLSARIEHFLHPGRETETICNFMYHVFKDTVNIQDDLEETRDVQVFLAVRRAYAKEDLAFLRYHLFIQYFGDLTEKNLASVIKNFNKGYEEIEKQLNYPLKSRIYSYIRSKTAPFFVLDDFLRQERGNILTVVKDEEEFKNIIGKICQRKYDAIISKVRTAVIRSVIFVLLTKTIFALSLEGTYENLAYGRILWGSMAASIIIPPILMALSTLLISTPGKSNTERIFNALQVLLFSENPKISDSITLKISQPKTKSKRDILFTLLWSGAFLLSFGLVFYILSLVQFNIVSKLVFMFFLAIISFLSYRINQTANILKFNSRQSLFSPIVDFFFMPIVRVGRYLQEGISQVNIFLFILDFVIETPFKGIFAFFEQWFLFLHSKRVDLE